MKKFIAAAALRAAQWQHAHAQIMLGSIPEEFPEIALLTAAAIAKTVAKLTRNQHDDVRQQEIEQHYDAEFRREETISAVGSHAKH